MSGADLTSRLTETEKVLQGLPLVNIGINYDNGTESINGPAYLLPIKKHQCALYGLFVNASKIFDAKIGFTYEKEGLQNAEYYNLAIDGGLKPFIQDSTSIYLPLKNTNLQRGTPNKILGINGAKGIFPLMYFFETSDQIMYVELSESIENKVKSQMFSGNDPAINAHVVNVLREMSQGRIVYETESKENKTPIKAKSKIEIMAANLDWKDPQEIIKHLNKFVVGQEEAKEVMAGVFSNYLIKVETDNPQIRKTNVMMTGPTGVGKTLIAETLAKSAGLHFERIKVGGKTPEGYIGDNLGSGLINVREKMPDEDAPYAVILLDEIDKIASSSKPEMEERMQNQILGWSGSEGDTIHFRQVMAQDKKLNPLDTRNLLFIASGAFSKNIEGKALEDIIKEKSVKKTTIGFQAPSDEPIMKQDLVLQATPKDIIKYGFKDEFVRRFPVITSLKHLTVEQKTKILTEAKDSIWTSYQILFKERDLNVQIDDEIPEIIAEACPNETGARALDTSCSQLFTPILINAKKFEDDQGIIKITPELAQEILYGTRQKEKQKEMSIS